MAVVNLGFSYFDTYVLQLHSTESTWLILGSYNRRYKAIMNHFFHRKTASVYFNESGSAREGYIRGRLPNKSSLKQVLNVKDSKGPRYKVTFLCLITLRFFYFNRGVLKHEGESVSYKIHITCSDGPTECNLIFKSEASTALLRISADELATKSKLEQRSLIKEQMGKNFAAEIYMPAHPQAEPYLHVHNIYHPITYTKYACA